MTWANYVKIKKIGEGSFGAAWLVKYVHDNKHYVIKQINVAKMPTRERDEAKKEVSVLAQMKHPNIVSYIDSFEEGGNLCIVMDYCDGGDLYSKIQSMRGVSIGEDQIIDWFVQITLALKHVHDRKILHRDLKSQNIFLTKDGVIKLGDFGVAKVLNNTSEFAKTAIGTPYYMSPEICEHKPYNNKSDVWSLGCILYEMTNMKHPFLANNLQMLICKILRGNYDQVSPKYSYELRNLIACMLKRNPRERPSVNGILRKPFIMKRCEKFLTNEEMMDEFSHTVLHGENFKNRIQNQNLINKPSVVKVGPKQSVLNVPSPVIIAPRYDPSKIYKAPVVPRAYSALQKSVEKKVVYIKRRPPSAERVRSSFLDQREKKKELEEALKWKQKELLEKQKMERLNKAREMGWQNVIQCDEKESKSDERPKEEKYGPYPFVNNNRGSAEPEMNVSYLEKFEKQLAEHAKKRSQLEEEHEKLANKFKNPIPVPRVPQPAVRKSLNNGPERPVSKNRFIDDFKKNKDEYERNRANGKRIYNNPIVPKPPLVKKNDEQLVFERLRQIRNQNYLKRKPIVPIKPNIKMPVRSSFERQQSENALKRIAALKQQREDMLNKEKKNSERREDAYQKEKQFNEKIQKDFKPGTQIDMTKLLGDIGVVGKKISNEEVLKNPSEVYASSRTENRKSWQKASDLKTLEDKTLIQPTIIPDISPRKEWGAPHSTVLKVLEDAQIQTKTVSIDDKTLKPSKSSSLSSTKSDLLENEKPPKIMTNTFNFKATSDDVLNNISPIKMETLKQTRNVLIEMTLGRFDPKNTKLLRTCSEPDIFTKILNEEQNTDDEDIVVPNNKISATGKVGTGRLVRSLDDLDIKQEKMPEILENSSEQEDFEKVSSISSEEAKSDTETDDLKDVIETMQSYLLASDDDDDIDFKSKKTIRKREMALDSLEISKQKIENITDENDCEVVSLNGDESDGSDTEFEDDKVDNCSNEERRANLEKILGHEKFAKNFRPLQDQIYKEENDKSSESNESRRSYELFCKIFPDVDPYLYGELFELIRSDMKLNSHL